MGSLHAQFTSRLGRFQVDQVRGCAPFTINITNTNLITTGECTGLNPCLMDYQGNGTQQQNIFTFIYPTAGTFKLSVLYQSIGADDITITVDPNIQPAFEVYTCSNSQVSIKVTDKNYDQYSIDFGDGSPVVQIPFSNNQVAQRSYASNGTFNISVRGRKLNAANNCNSLVKSFQAVTALPISQISALTAVDASTLKLDFTPLPNIQYRLEIAVNSTNFQQLQTLYGVNTTNITSLRLDDNYYCFRLSSFDPCTGQNSYSQPVCSQNFDLTLSSDLNQLKWVTATAPAVSITSVAVFRNNGLYTSIPGAPITYLDNGINCNVTYCYQLKSTFAGGGVSSSLEKCGKAFTTIKPTKITNISAVVSSTGVQLNWLQDPTFSTTSYSIFRSTNLGVYIPFASATSTQYQDESYATGSAFCYKVNYADKCNNKSSDSDPACPIRLQGVLNNKNEISLSWSDYSGWILGVKNYLVEKYDKNGTLIKTFNVGTGSSFVDDQPDPKNQLVSYRIVALPMDGTLVSSSSNQVDLIKEINLFYPTAFTPDKKGPTENEVFTVNGQFIVKLEISIFDRWGSLIFYTDKNEPWDGSQLGQPMPIASYVWTANITDLAGRSLKRSGTVILIRK